MGKLTAKQRENLPAKDFGLPERARYEGTEARDRQLPHARPWTRDQRLASRERQRELGNLTKDEFERIDRKARRKLRKRRPK